MPFPSAYSGTLQLENGAIPIKPATAGRTIKIAKRIENQTCR